MFGFGKKKENAQRRDFREEFESMARRLRTAPDATQIAVGHAINLAHSTFATMFGSAGAFKSLSYEERAAYIQKLSAAEEKFLQPGHSPSAVLGVGLFKMWVGTLHAGDTELERKLADELACFSRKGE
jgi:hypothetical protein